MTSRESLRVARSLWVNLKADATREKRHDKLIQADAFSVRLRNQGGMER